MIEVLPAGFKKFEWDSWKCYGYVYGENHYGHYTDTWYAVVVILDDGSRKPGYVRYRCQYSRFTGVETNEYGTKEWRTTPPHCDHVLRGAGPGHDERVVRC